MWSDELYTAAAAGVNSPAANLFSDPGNPPLFYILAKIWIYILGNGESILRMLPAVFSVLTIFVIYKFVKSNLNEKAGLFCAFLFSINLYSIFSAKEFRCYSLCILFAVISAYYLFRIIKFKKNKDCFIYAVIASLMANTHYFQILILTGNFIYGLFKLDNKLRLKFFAANLAAAFAFLPYFMTTALNKALLNDAFRRTYSPDCAFLINTFNSFFTSNIVSILIFATGILLLIPKIRNYLFEFNKENKNILDIYIYSLYIILFTYISSYLFSWIKPIISDYYFIGTLAFNVILCGLFLFIPWKNIKLKIILFSLFILFFLSGNLYVRRDYTAGMFNSLEDILKYSYFDSSGNCSLIILHDALSLSDSNKKIFDSRKNRSFATHTGGLYYKKYLTGKEQHIYYYIWENEYWLKLKEHLKESEYDVTYVDLIHHSLLQFIIALLQDEYYNISFVRTGKSKLVARIVKRKIK